MAMWINDDIDIPEALLAAQRDGRLVIFAGAGVSMGSPSNLPGFSDLAIQIAAGVLEPAENEAFDVFLGRVSAQGVDVQTLARQHLDVPGSTHRRLHSLIVDLFGAEDTVRIVTTNFDRHFTTALRIRYPNVDIFTAPALPLGRDFSGLVYIHGSLARREPLVLTDLEFGRAYLIDGYATRFLTEMFAEYVVLFVGYRHRDVVMQYLARAFIRAKERFAFSTAAESPRWKQLGITPIVFPTRPEPEPFGAIDDALAAWVERKSMGLFDHEARIRTMVSTPPPLARDLADYARAVIGETRTLGFFVRDCESLEWFQWVENEGFLNGLTSPAAPMTERDGMLADWISRILIVNHANKGLDFIQRHATTLHPRFATMLAWSLAHRHKDVQPNVLKPWIVTLMALDCQPAPHHPLSDLLKTCCAQDDTIDVAFLLFQFMLRPRITLQRRWVLSATVDTRVSANIELELLGDVDDLKEAWETLSAQLKRAHRALFAAVTGYLEEAFAIDRGARDAGKWDALSFSRSAIEPHEQDRHPDDWEFLVDVARDLLEWLLEHEPSLGFFAMDLWERSDSQVLQRLAIHGWGKRTDMAPESVLQHIIDRGWLYGRGLKHEVFVVLKSVFPAASIDEQVRFIEYSMSQPVLNDADGTEGIDIKGISDYERYNVGAWLRKIAPDSDPARQHFAALQAQHPAFGVRDHLDFDHYISTAWRKERSPVTATDLAGKGADDAIDAILRFKQDPNDVRGPSHSGLMIALQQGATENHAWSEEVAAVLIARTIWDARIWTALLSAWRVTELTASSWGTLLTTLDDHAEISRAAPAAVADVLERAAESEGLATEHLDRIERIGDRVLTYSSDLEPGVHRNGHIDWLTSAIIHPAGHVALSWLKVLSTRLAADHSEGIPAAQRTRYEALLGDQGPNGLLGRVAFASQAHFLFNMDADWTTAHVVPLFDWSIDADRAEQAWSGFLTWGNWTSDVFFDRMRVQTIQTFSHLDRLKEGANSLTTRLAAAAVYSAHDPWVNRGWLWEFIRVADADNLQEWARSFGRYMESLPAEGAAQLWKRWLRGFCQQRGLGIPRAFEDREKDAMVEWVIPLKSVLIEVVSTFEAAAATPATLQHYTLYRLNESHLAQSHSLLIGRFLRLLLERAQSLSYACDEAWEVAIEALANGAARQDILRVAENMARLGCPNATQLRDRANDQ
jgi:SIR2-like protein